MGRYSDTLADRMRARRVAVDIRHPRGYKGMVMWCSTCRAELLRAPSTRVVSPAQQQAAVDGHDCKLRNAERMSMVRRQIERGARRGLRRVWLRRWRWYLVALLVASLTIAVWLIGLCRG